MLTEKIQLEPDEIILAQVRKHWFVLATQLLSIVVVSIIPFFLYIFAARHVDLDARLHIDSTVWFIALYSGWLVFMWMSLFSVWTNYYLDVWTITSKRLIAVDQRGLFNRETGSFRLERLQDINVSVHGMIPTFLDFGDLRAETASEDRSFIAYNIPHPQDLKSLILRATDTTTYGTKTPENQGSEV